MTILSKIVISIFVIIMIVLNIYALNKYKTLLNQFELIESENNILKSEKKLIDDELILRNLNYSFIKKITDTSSAEVEYLADVNIFLFFSENDCILCLSPLIAFLDEVNSFYTTKTKKIIGVKIIKDSGVQTTIDKKYYSSIPTIIETYSNIYSNLNDIQTPFIIVTNNHLSPILAFCADHRFNNRIDNLGKQIKILLERN